MDNPNQPNPEAVNPELAGQSLPADTAQPVAEDSPVGASKPCNDYKRIEGSDKCATCGFFLVEHENKTPQTGPKGIAWDQVLNDYITADNLGRYPSLRDLAEKYEVTIGVIGERSSRENWIAKRNESITKTEQMAAESKAVVIEKKNAEHLAVWQVLKSAVADRLAIYQIKFEKYKTTVSPEMGAVITGNDDPGSGELTSIINQYRSVIEGERIVLGLPIIINKSEVKDERPAKLSPEMIKEIDRLYDLNKNDKPDSDNN